MVEAAHLKTALAALEFQRGEYEAMQARLPQTRGGDPNLAQRLNEIVDASMAIERYLGSYAD